MSTVDITYTALRSIIGGHVSGTDYTLTFTPQEVLPSRVIQKRESRSLSGRRETIGQRIESRWQIQSDLISDSDYPQWQEFIDSTAFGESVTADLSNILTEQAAPISVTISGSPNIQRVSPLPLWTVSFEVEQVV